jgi:gamma-glutamylcyclotransferase (GGCT)/AIG2-like uncharacterized protein YtfP
VTEAEAGERADVDDDANEYHLPLFVYGTLRDPLIVRSLVGAVVWKTEPAIALGRRHQVSASYPAVSFQSPEDEIQGELLWLAPEAFENAIRRLDDYEGSPEVFRRVRIRVRLKEGHVQAYSYEWHHE